jgi:hypothetical protein
MFFLLTIPFILPFQAFSESKDEDVTVFPSHLYR